ncbi:MAG: Oxoglutarate dehydrogenase inhibitor [Pelotomaculum sp. PtaU1.Bin035]|nr:MAG: Oxoglutarate dehydrogenase inhibitor [Pelotomaculum sp. PtaU1.Bin035]
MGVFSDLEGNLEKYIEGFFKDKFKGRIQPVDIAKRLSREMRDRRRVSVNKIYAPNQYTVFLNPSDYDNINAFTSTLSMEMQDYVLQKAGEKKYTLAGPPVVNFAGEESLETGSMRIESGFSEALPEDEPLEHTQFFHLNKGSVLTEKAPVVYGRLQVEAGPDRGRCFELGAIPLVVGRHAGCDVVLNDTSVSRRHARLEWRQGQYTVTDLGSTNGTRVNGLRISTKTLKPGDVLTLGTTICTFKVE